MMKQDLGVQGMKIHFGFNDIMPDGMGSAAVNLLTALQREGIAFQTVHPWRKVQVQEFLQFRPIFLTDGDEPPLADVIQPMIDAINRDPACTHFSHFGSPNWGAITPYLRPDIKLVVSVHSITPSALKIALAYRDRTSMFVPVSWKVEERLKACLPKSQHSRIMLVTNAIDVKAYRQKDDPVDARPHKILFMGRIEDVTKGCDKIPKIAEILKARGVLFQWDLYGYFHWGYEKAFHDEVKRHGVGDVVCHKGCLSPAQMRDMISQYDVVVVPSNHEGFGLVVIEAMASAVPCVVSRLEGVTDRILVNGESGVLVGKNDLRGFADAIEKLLRDDVLRQTMGQAGYRSVLERFDLPAHGAAYRKVFEHAMQDTTVHAQQQLTDPATFRLPENLKSHILARILPLSIKKILKRIL